MRRVRYAIIVGLVVGPVAAGLVTASGQQPPASPAHVDAVANDLRLLAEHPALVAGVAPFHRYVSSESTLPARDRELLILRTAALTRSDYVFSNHGNAARAAGLSNEEIMRAGDGPLAAGWSAFDAALLQTADELLAASFVNNATWAALATRYTRLQLMDAVFTVAHYSMWAMITNTTLTVTVNRPIGVQQPAVPPRPARETRHHTALATPRIPPLDPLEWTPAVRAMLDPSGQRATGGCRVSRLRAASGAVRAAANPV